MIVSLWKTQDWIDLSTSKLHFFFFDVFRLTVFFFLLIRFFDAFSRSAFFWGFLFATMALASSSSLVMSLAAACLSLRLPHRRKISSKTSNSKSLNYWGNNEKLVFTIDNRVDLKSNVHNSWLFPTFHLYQKIQFDDNSYILI